MKRIVAQREGSEKKLFRNEGSGDGVPFYRYDAVRDQTGYIAFHRFWTS